MLPVSHLTALLYSQNTKEQDLRKLIKYEATLGININQDNYFENLFKRTTASFRAKVGKENVRCERVVKENYTRNHDQHVLRPLNQLAQHQQPDSRAAITKKGPQTQTAHSYSNTRSGATTEGGGVLRNSNKNHQSQQHKPPQSGPSRNARNLENLCREQAWQSDNRIPFGECPESRGPQHEAAERGRTRVSQTRALVRERSLKRVQPATGSNEVRTGRSKAASCATARDGGNSQPAQAVVARDASHGRARAKQPNHERGATARSPSAGSSATARSVGVIIPRHCTTTRRRRPLSTDPVALYHYYQSEWNHFREQIPGESSHADLRWLIRTRLMDPN
ncbi:uncharacterized protein LOC118741187 [Rhagoletis pomonella]|uniref:uncharacterized protein LOC118741187 n=1 Tax=Rhagoletis pomonella TaxID=28610 RepID=UPI0017839A6A|nr:uncharacterized protein LOC118741187 [Rhagoletis pomonella]